MRETKESLGFQAWGTLGAVALMVIAASLGPASSAARAGAYTDQFRLQDCRWGVTGGNPHLKLRSGYQLVLEGEDEEEGTEVRVEITVLREYERLTVPIAGVDKRVRTRVVEEREWEDGELIEVSRNFLAECKETGDVFYFGEDVDNYEDGEIADHEGAWRAGEDGAMPGLLMPGTFLKGARYFQELAPEADALDRGRHVDMGLEIPTPAGTFSDCVAVIDTTPLEPGAEDLKIYCPGIGLVMDEDLELIEFGIVN